jgi:putative addiction module killer protein
VEITPRHLELYLTPAGRCPFEEWLHGLKDAKGRAKIRQRLDRLEMGNFGFWRDVGGGVKELKVDFGPGYRVYFGCRSQHREERVPELKRTSVDSASVIALARAARLQLSQARAEDLAGTLGAVFGLLDRLDEVALGEIAPAFAYQAKWAKVEE